MSCCIVICLFDNEAEILGVVDQSVRVERNVMSVILSRTVLCIRVVGAYDTYSFK